MNLRSRSLNAIGAVLVSASMLFSPAAESCTRFVYLGVNDQIITARSMDWKTGTNLWIFPRGMKRSGRSGTELDPVDIEIRQRHCIRP
jgi:penicillin V acylase-like amidase (Ntn superfamily)